MAAIAEYEGFCVECEEKISQGDSIVKDSDKWIHLDCDDPTIEDSDEDDDW